MVDYGAAFAGGVIAAVIGVLISWGAGPFVLSRFRQGLLAAVVLDGLAATLAVLLLHSVPELLPFAWVRTGFGWLLVGLLSSLIVRGNLAEIGIGEARLGVGFGLFYSPLRAPIDVALFDQWHTYTKSRHAAVIDWANSRISPGSGQTTYAALAENYLAYVEARRDREGPYRLWGNARATAEQDIASAETHREYSRRASVLLTLVVRRGLTGPVFETFGIPGRREILRLTKQRLGSP